MSEIDYNEDQTLPAFDGKKIHYVARNCSDPSKPLVLHVHGLPDSPRGLLGATSGEFFADHGYAHASLYLNIDYDPTARSLADLTFDTARRDLGLLVDHLAQGRPSVFLTAHSIGAAFALAAAPPAVRAYSLWDPATDSIGFLTGKRLLPPNWQAQGGANVAYQTRAFLGEKLIYDMQTYDHRWFLHRARTICQPTLIFAAGNNGIFQLSGHDPEECRAAFPYGQLVTLPESGHTLSTPGTRERVYAQTLALFESCRA